MDVSAEILAKAANGDTVALAKCRKGFEAVLAKAEADCASGTLSGAEANHVALADPAKQLSAVEKAALVAGLRAPGLYESYARAVNAGVPAA